MEPLESNSRPDAPKQGGSWLTTLSWAAYLACSWTWCIGMFLPVLLVRDFGVLGFVAFAVPNVLGAAGMGWIVKTPGASERLVQQHQVACKWFSGVTMSFQMFFIWWLVSMVPTGPLSSSGCGWLVMGLCVAGIVMACLSMDPDGSIDRRNAALHPAREPRHLRVLSAPPLLWLISMAFAAMLLWRRELWFDPARLPAPTLPSTAVIALAPVCCFGFGLCPYLDLTFHHARRRAPGKPGTSAFTLGFGLLFLAMILFTLGYAHLFLDGHSLTHATETAATLRFIVVCHILVQAFFTFMIHMFQLVGLPKNAGRPRFQFGSAAGLIPVVACTTFLPMLAPWLNEFLPAYRGLMPAEIIYRCYMVFYGLAFPAYVWLCMIPTRDGHSGLNRAKLRILAAAVGVATPMFWMGFIERQTWWLGPGLAAVLLARLFLPRGKDMGRGITT